MKRILTALVLGISLLVASGGFVYAQDFNKGVEAYKKGDYATALNDEVAKKIVEALSQFNDDKPFSARGRGFRAISVLAEQGNADAQNILGLMYKYGQGVSGSVITAMEWFHKSAEQGNAMAQYNLGRSYSNIMGEGPITDDKEAMKWYRKSAEQGNADAQNALGIEYLRGQVILKDHVYAHMWFNIASLNGNEYAAENRDNAAKRMTTEQLAEALKFARECVRKKFKRC